MLRYSYALSPRGLARSFGSSPNYQFNFQYFGSSDPLGLTWVQSGWAYKTPYQSPLERKWNRIGVDPRKVTGVGPYTPQGTTKERLSSVNVETPLPQFPYNEEGFVVQHSVPAEPTIQQPDVESKARPLADKLLEDAEPILSDAAEPISSRSPRLSRSSIPPVEYVRKSTLLDTLKASISPSSRSPSPASSDLSGDGSGEYTETPLRGVKRVASTGSLVKNTRRKTNSGSATETPSPPDASSEAEGLTTPEGPHLFPCPHDCCPQVCKRYHDLKRHLQSAIHTPPSFFCRTCDQAFTREDALKRHEDSRCENKKAKGKANTKKKAKKAKKA